MPQQITASNIFCGHDAGGRSAERETDTDLLRPLRDRVRHHRVDADRCEHEEQRTEHSEHSDGNAAENQIRLDVIVERPYVIDG